VARNEGVKKGGAAGKDSYSEDMPDKIHTGRRALKKGLEAFTKKNCGMGR
jgi:hypothetical protein